MASREATRTLAPGMIQNIDHVNIVVADLETMTRFYRDTLGLTVTKDVVISGPWVERTVGIQGVVANVVYLELPGGGPRIELIAYANPPPVALNGVDLPNGLGLRHLALRVSDIEGAVARLKDAGVEFFSAVQTVPDAQVRYAGGARKRIVYFKDPEANLLELCEYRA